MKRTEQPPVYSRVAYDIAAKIVSDELKEGQKFTGRSLLGSQYGVSSETVRRALGMLANMGILSVQQNVGFAVLSRQRAAEYVEQFQADKDLLTLKNRLRELTDQRNILNEQISATFSTILDLQDRFRYSDRMHTYEFTLGESGGAAGKSIGTLQFRQQTGATIVTVRRRDGQVLLSPGPQTLLAAGDVLIVACSATEVDKVSRLIGKKNESE